jgi:hypothetical protein
MKIKASGQTEEGSLYKIILYKKNPAIVVDDSIYEINERTREGAAALAAGVPYNIGNPYQEDTLRHEDWNYGHELAQDESLASLLALSKREIAKLAVERW